MAIKEVITLIRIQWHALFTVLRTLPGTSARTLPRSMVFIHPPIMVRPTKSPHRMKAKHWKFFPGILFIPFYSLEVKLLKAIIRLKLSEAPGLIMQPTFKTLNQQLLSLVIFLSANVFQSIGLLIRTKSYVIT